jgi:hypothetical protein
MTIKCDPDDYEAGSFATLQIITGVGKTMLILNRQETSHQLYFHDCQL